MDRHQIKQPIGWILIGLSVFVVFGTLRNKYGGGPPMPALVPIFDTPFVFLFLGLLVGLCIWFRTAIGLAWITGAFVVGLIGGSIGESFWSGTTNSKPNPAVEQVLSQHGLSAPDYDWTRHKLVMGSCLGGIAVGFGFAREKL